MTRKKWEIPFIPRDQDIARTARAILAYRLREVLALVEEFRRTHEVESLHRLRIALRRLRYPMETFLSLFPRRSGLRILRAVNMLQQSAGGGRDLDVMLRTLEEIREKDPAAVPESLLRRLEKKKLRRYGSIDTAFERFLGNDALYAFKVMIAFDELLPTPAEPSPASPTEPPPRKTKRASAKKRSLPSAKSTSIISS